MEQPLTFSWQELYNDIISCRKCPRLVEWREKTAVEKRRAFKNEEYWGKPVPGFGDSNARIVLLGLAPGAHGSNRTGRMFTGDGSGITLIGALHRAGLADRAAPVDRHDGLALNSVFMTSVARCAPPGNKPTPQELLNCRPFLLRELNLLAPTLNVVIALGRIAFESYLHLLKEQGYTVPRLNFAHGAEYALEPTLPRLLACYHPSRQNTQTGRLTPEMLNEVLEQAGKGLVPAHE
jgi:uracil-DNA glycosylase